MQYTSLIQCENVTDAYDKQSPIKRMVTLERSLFCHKALIEYVSELTVMSPPNVHVIDVAIYYNKKNKSTKG